MRQLVDLLGDESPAVRSSAINALGSIGRANPNYITLDIVQKLIGLNDDGADPLEDLEIQYIAGENALDLIGQANPECITSDFVQQMVKSLNGPTFFSYFAADALGSIEQANPELITPEIIRKLVAMLYDADPNLRSSAADAIGSIGYINPEHITPEAIQQLFELLGDEDPAVRLHATDAIGSIGQTGSRHITTEILQRLFDLLDDENFNVRESAWGALGFIGQAGPEHVTLEIVQQLVGLLRSKDSSYYYSSGYEAFGSIAATRSDQFTPEILGDLFGILKDNRNALGRVNVSFVLFALAYGDANQKRAIRDELTKILGSSQIFWRIAAAKTLTMITISDSVDKARAHPENIEQIKKRLERMRYLDMAYFYYALSFTEDEIEKIEAESNK